MWAAVVAADVLVGGSAPGVVSVEVGSLDPGVVTVVVGTVDAGPVVTGVVDVGAVAVPVVVATVVVPEVVVVLVVVVVPVVVPEPGALDADVVPAVNPPRGPRTVAPLGVRSAAGPDWWAAMDGAADSCDDIVVD